MSKCPNTSRLFCPMMKFITEHLLNPGLYFRVNIGGAVLRGRYTGKHLLSVYASVKSAAVVLDHLLCCT